MATLATQVIARTGIIPAYASAAGGGDRFTPNKDTFLHVKNGSGGSITVTVVTPHTDAWGNAIADNAVAIAAGVEKMMGPYPAESYGAPADGLADITYSGVTSLTIAALMVAEP